MIQIFTTHRWERKKAAQDLADNMHTCGYYENVAKLRKIKGTDGNPIDVNRKDQTYDTVVDEDNKEKVREYLLPILGLCEEIALGVRHKIYNDKVAYDYFGFFVPDYYRWAKPFIEDVRETTEDDTIYEQMEELSRRWEARNKKNQRKEIDSDSK